MPDEPQATAAMKIIRERAPRHNGALFAPHVTWLGDILVPTAARGGHASSGAAGPDTVAEAEAETEADAEADVVRRVGNIVRTSLPPHPFEIPFLRADSGERYFRCVYALCERTDLIVAANTALQREFGHDETFMPHLSLIYSNMPREERRVVAQELDADVRGMGGIRVTSVELVDTTGPPDVWRTIHTWGLPGEC